MSEQRSRFRTGFYPEGRDIIWYTETPDIQAVDRPAEFDQQAFAWGDPGTEAGHSLDAVNTDRTVAADGEGNYLAFLRWDIEQTNNMADSALTATFKLQYRKDGGTWTDVTASSSNVRVIADSNIADGASVANNRVSSSAFTFLAGEYDEGDGTFDAITFTANATEHTELLTSLEFIDANLNAGEVLDFRIIHSDDNLLDTYTGVADATLTWNATGGSVPLFWNHLNKQHSNR